MATDRDLLSGIALTTFKLNSQMLRLAERLAQPAGLTAARWQVLGAVLHEPLTVAAIARQMGLARQSVQRVADVLVEQGMLERLPNPAHARASLLRATDAGLAAVHRIDPQHATFAAQLAEHVGHDQLTGALERLTQLSAALDALEP